MTASTYQIPGGSRVLVHYCECGDWGAFGRRVNLREALRTGDVSRAGIWTCGPNGCAKQEKVE